PLCTVTEVTHHYFPHKRHISFYYSGVFMNIRVHFCHFLNILIQSLEYTCNRLSAALALAIHELMPRGNIKFYCCYTCSVLTSVMLFFHQQVQFVQTVKSSTVFSVVIS